jgi:glyoxylase-like metal-dependent hydrolase (beta-lactamase superfamily II)
MSIFKKFGALCALTVGLTALVSCAMPAKEAEMKEAEMMAGEEAKPALKLYVFDCGYITANDLSIFSAEGYYKGETKELAGSCYLIQHPTNGMLIWDVGLSDSLAANPEGVVVGGGAFTLKVKKTLASQLQEIGVNPADVTYIAFSHLHFDHTGNANEFATSTWLVQEPEYTAGFGPDAEKLFFDPASYSKLKDGKVTKLNGDHDVFGDGSVVIYAAPGHTPGHQVLFVDLPKTGPLVLSGDLYHFEMNRVFRRVPAFNFNQEESRIAIERIEDIVAREDATFWIQHDLEQNATIKHSPEFYE